MTIQVSKKVNEKRNKRLKKEACLLTPEQAEFHRRSRKFLDSVDDISKWMSIEMLVFLSESVDEINNTETELRLGLQKYCRRLLSSIARKTEQVIFFHEALPGFTVLAVKKDGWFIGGDDEKENLGSDELNLDDERDDAIKSIVDTYVERTGNRVVAIDGEDLTLVLFPVSDLKQNLLEMGFWGA